MSSLAERHIEEARPVPAIDRPGPILVGIDGSATAHRALTWALAEGAARGVPVTVVHAWSTLTAGEGMTCPSEESAEQFLRSQITEASTDLPVPPPIVTVVSAGSAAPVLVELSSSASMLVLGQSRRAGERGMLAGSVCAICARRAHAPVVIVTDRGEPVVHHRPELLRLRPARGEPCRTQAGGGQRLSDRPIRK